MMHQVNPLLAQKINRVTDQFHPRLIDTEHGQISYRRCGQGQSIVLLHGIGSGSASWFDCALILADAGFDVIAWDAPGYGESDNLAEQQPSAVNYAASLLAFLNALNVTQAHIVGHSLGALMAAALTQLANQHVIDTLILASPARGYGDAKSNDGLMVLNERMDKLGTLGVSGVARARAPFMLSPQASAEKVAWVEWNMSCLRAEGYQQAAFMLCDDDIARYVNDAKPYKTAVLVGTDDVITVPAKCEAIAELYQAPCLLISNAGHACYVDEPAHVAAHILQHIRFDKE